MIEEAEKDGCLKPGGTIVEASTGNTATALAFVGACRGYKVLILIPEQTANEERISIITKFGAETRKTSLDSMAGTEVGDASIHGGFYEIPGRILARDMEDQPNIWWARQFCNPDNAAAHRDGTGGEILAQMDGERVDAVVASVGTGGTLVGLAEALQESSPLVVAVEPAGHPMLSSGLADYPLIEGITDGFMHAIVRDNLADRMLALEDSQAIKMTHRLIREEGLFCGISSGANVLAALMMGRETKNCQSIVTVLPDSYTRYLTAEHYVT